MEYASDPYSILIISIDRFGMNTSYTSGEFGECVLHLSWHSDNLPTISPLASFQAIDPLEDSGTTASFRKSLHLQAVGTPLLSACLLQFQQRCVLF